jgi:hypothetical protein
MCWPRRRSNIVDISIYHPRRFEEGDEIKGNYVKSGISCHPEERLAERSSARTLPQAQVSEV